MEWICIAPFGRMEDGRSTTLLSLMFSDHFVSSSESELSSPSESDSEIDWFESEFDSDWSEFESKEKLLCSLFSRWFLLLFLLLFLL